MALTKEGSSQEIHLFLSLQIKFIHEKVNSMREKTLQYLFLCMFRPLPSSHPLPRELVRPFHP